MSTKEYELWCKTDNQIPLIIGDNLNVKAGHVASILLDWQSILMQHNKQWHIIKLETRKFIKHATEQITVKVRAAKTKDGRVFASVAAQAALRYILLN